MTALCSARMFSPLLRMIVARNADRDLVPDVLWSADPDDRVPLDASHTMLERAVERFGDEQLGLKLGSSMCLGESGPLDYLLRSAATVRESVDVAGRYSVLYADSYRVWFETWRTHALIRVLDEASWPRPVADFTMSSAYRLHVGELAPFPSRLECWFPYSAPRDPSEHERVFAGSVLKFDAPFYAFAFDRSYAGAAHLGADPELHAVLRDRVDSLVAHITRSFELKARVRRVIDREIRNNQYSTAPSVARALLMSRRSLSRKLEREGTTFADELDTVRRELALAMVREAQRPLTEVAFLLGFSHVESFHRAFKRWTGITPLAYRAHSAVRLADFK